MTTVPTREEHRKMVESEKRRWWSEQPEELKSEIRDWPGLGEMLFDFDGMVDRVAVVRMKQCD